MPSLSWRSALPPPQRHPFYCRLRRRRTAMSDPPRLCVSARNLSSCNYPAVRLLAPDQNHQIGSDSIFLHTLTCDLRLSMEQMTNAAAPEAPTDERASASNPAPPEFEPVPLRYRTDGWTPAKQREFVEALRDTGVIRQALSRVGLSEQGLGRLRRRPEARTFDLACMAAQRLGVRGRLVSTAYERAIEGTVKGRYYHGELKGEERVYNDRLLMFLIGKLGPLLEPPGESRRVDEDWEGWMQAIERRAPPPPPPERPFDGTEVWEQEGRWWTSFPPPPDFAGQEGKTSRGGYKRTLSGRERA